MKKILILFLVFISVLGVGCTKKQTPDSVKAYIMIINQLYTEDSALNHNIKYLAIDTSLIINLTDEGKDELLNQLKYYGHEVLDMSFEELEKQGYIQDLSFKEGVLFRIEDKKIKNNSITMKASKWRSGLGAIGYNDVTIKYNNGKWKITNLGGPWIS